MSATRLHRSFIALVLVLAALVAAEVAGSAAQAKPRITAAASSASASVGARVTVTGRASGAPAGQQVRLQRRAGSRWTTVTTKKLSSSKPRKVSFSITVRPGTTRYRLALVPRRGAPGATSNALSVTGIPRITTEGPVEPVVQGNRLVDARTGATWVPRGVNWPDLEYSCSQGWKPSHVAADTAAMASWGIDLMRLPLNQDCWLGTDGAPADEWQGAADYRATVRQRVDWALDAGLAVILDLHRTGPEGIRAGDGQRAMADQQSITFWGQVAAAYKDEPSVMFELYNEPYNVESFGSGALDWDCWRDGGCRVDTANEIEVQQNGLSGVTYEVAGMAEMLAAVRSSGADQPVLLGGLNWSNDLTGWLGHKPADEQLVAAWHNYYDQGCSQPCWNSTIKSVQAQVPVLMTEFGYSNAKPSWMETVMDWGDANGVGYLAWAWWNLPAQLPATDQQYALLKPDSYQPRPPAGTTYFDHLQSLR
jgi:endoglucanase